jgi:hypothetical protein
MLRDEFDRHRAFLGGWDDCKEYPGRGNPYRFAFPIQPQRQPLVMFLAGTGTASPVVRDDAAGLAVPRLIERDRAAFSDLMPHQSIPRQKNNNFF